MLSSNWEPSMIHTDPTRLFRPAVLALSMLVMSCSGNPDATHFTNPNFDFGFIERVAVMPLESLSDDQAAGERTTRILITELLASGALDVVEPGELNAALGQMRLTSQLPSNEQVISLGQTLGVQGLMVGSVTQFEVIRSGAVSYPVVTLDLHLLETETGAAVWAATHTEQGSTGAARLLGSGGQPISAVTRKCVREILESLFG